MAIPMAVFGGSAFEAASMVRALDRRPYRPSMLVSAIGFETVSATTDTVYVVSRQRYLNLIRTTLRGAAIEMAAPEDQNARPLRIPRLAKGDKLFAHELANVMPFEDQTVEGLAAQMIARKQEKLIDDCEATFENMALGALNGIILDTDGNTLVNFFTEFGVAAPGAVDLTLDNLAMTIGELREKIATLLTIPIARASGAGNDPRFRLRAVCGDNFWFKLTGHPAVEKTYLNYQAASELRDEKLWTSFIFAGVEWIHYRGTDDGTTMAISTNSARVFPVGVPGMWQHVMGPANEFLPFMHQPGRRFYPMLIQDKDRDQWVQPEIYSYPLFINARPDLVLTATV
jgi:Phage major capsid protein E